MAEARLMSGWDQTAWLCYHIPRFSSRRVQPADFNPMRSKDRQSNLIKLEQQFGRFSQILPKTLTEEEIDRRWSAYCAAQAGNKGRE